MQSITVDVHRQTVVRRYMSLRVFELLLKNKALYFSRFDSFVDRLEGGIGQRNFSNISNDLEVFDLAMNKFPSLDQSLSVSGQRFDIEFSSFSSLFGEVSRDDGSDYLKRVSSWLYASCWTDLPHECDAMWQLYGTSGANCNHEGFCVECQATVGRSVCVETTIGSIVDNLELDSEHSLMVRKIEYLNHRTAVIEGSDMAIKPFFSKALHFSYENEIRFMVWPSEREVRFSYKYKEGTVNERPNVSLPIKDLSSFIGRVVLSPLAPEAQRKICKDHRARFQSDLGLAESLYNSKLREDVSELLLKYDVVADIVDSDLNQVLTTDIYTFANSF